MVRIAWVQIRDMEYHMAHESIPIAQERQMVKHIKKLRDSRPRVRQYEELYADVETARAAVHSGRGELKEMMEERQVYLACWSCLLIQFQVASHQNSTKCLHSTSGLRSGMLGC